jgi:S-disulfanyl-L-cysteine oxidoreductase SoxD
MSSMSVRLPALATLFCIFAPQAAAAPEIKTVWDGVYTEAQASRGEGAYSAECARCHKDDLTGYRSLLIGERFLNDWREDKLESFFTTLKNTMPRNAPASLNDGEYLDIVAYVLKMNSFPSGSSELTTSNVGDIRVQGKQGPDVVPDFALVEVTGCLIQSPDGVWKIIDATEPVRTRDPGDSPAAELKPLESRTAGPHSFRLLDTTVVRGDPPKDRKVEAKGFLIRKPGDDSINLTSLQPFGGACVNN